MTGWSTIGDGSMSSETDLSASMTLGQGHGGQPSLSIDPRLFQRKSTIFNREDEEEEEEGGKTAVPKIKSPARKKGGQGVNEGKRKASHARKVGFHVLGESGKEAKLKYGWYSHSSTRNIYPVLETPLSSSGNM